VDEGVDLSVADLIMVTLEVIITITIMEEVEVALEESTLKLQWIP
jgi:hypothetical protein